jgi:hypothetical protein
VQVIDAKAEYFPLNLKPEDLARSANLPKQQRSQRTKEYFGVQFNGARFQAVEVPGRTRTLTMG